MLSARTLLLYVFSFVTAIQQCSSFVVPNNQICSLSTSSRRAATIDSNIPSCITTPVLSQVYPALLEYKEQYGHPNIPLGSTEGRQCDSLRRLHIQQKLTVEEVELLNELGFRFHSLEDVYEHVEFDDLLGRLQTYQQSEGNTDVPKKYPLDPELGAWVTGIRRLGKDKVQNDHVEKLDTMNFQWISSRKCGSQFMNKYREIQGKLAEVDDAEQVWNDPETQKWIRAQRQAYKRETLSATRADYMTKLLGDEWWKQQDE